MPNTPPTTDDEALKALAALDKAAQRAAALDPSTAPALLAKLSDNPALAPLVASNPNTPVDLLLALAADHPREFLANPALPFLLLETPDLPLGMSRTAVAQMTRLEDVPLVILKQLGASKDPIIVEMSGAHVRIAGEYDGASAPYSPHNSERAAFEVAQVYSIRAAFGRMVHLTANGQRGWLQLLHLYPRWFLDLLAHDESYQSVALAHCRAMDAKSAQLPSRHGAEWSTGDAAEDIATRPLTRAEFMILATDRRFEIRVALAHRDDTPDEARRILARDDDYRVRHAVAIHPNTPPHLLLKLESDGSGRVRYGVASNPNTPPFALATLAHDKDHDVRAMVARNPSTPKTILDDLLSDEDNQVRVSLARNSACPQRLLVRLLLDRSDEVRCAALRRIDPTTPGVNVYGALLDDRLRAVVAENPHLPMTTFVQLTQMLDTPKGRLDHNLAEALASNPATPIETLDLLARLPGLEIATLVARNPHTTPATLAQLCVRAHESNTKPLYSPGAESLSWALAHNPATPDKALDDLAETGHAGIVVALVRRMSDQPERRDRIYRRLLRYHLKLRRPPFEPGTSGPGQPTVSSATNRFLSLVAMASPLLDKADYVQGVVSPLWSERYVLALNPAAPRAVVEALTHDGHRYVRAAARANLAARAATSAARRAPANSPANSLIAQPKRARKRASKPVAAASVPLPGVPLPEEGA